MKSVRPIALLLCLIALTAWPAEILGQPAPRRVVRLDVAKIDLARRELRAPARIKQRLARLRATIKTKKLNYRVGYTTALDRPPAALRGLKLPDDFAAQAVRQNALAAKLLKIDRGL